MAPTSSQQQNDESIEVDANGAIVSTTTADWWEKDDDRSKIAASRSSITANNKSRPSSSNSLLSDHSITSNTTAASETQNDNSNNGRPDLMTFRKRSAYISNDDLLSNEKEEEKASEAKQHWENLKQAVLTRDDLTDLLDHTAPKDRVSTTIQHRVQSFTEHPRNMNDCTIVAFINSGSGGGKGSIIYKDLVQMLGAAYVFDLGQCGKGSMPEDHLEKFALDPQVRVLACGGDGTMGWIESAIDKVWQTILPEGVSVENTPYSSHLPLALMPLGTGNDLSRSFGWGGTYKEKMRRQERLAKITTAEPSFLDRWRCVIIPSAKLNDAAKAWVPKMLAETTTTTSTLRNSEQQLFTDLFKEDNNSLRDFNDICSQASSEDDDDDEQQEMQVFDGVFCNYMSLGMDAEIAFSFHKERERYPEKFNSPLKNKLMYVKKARKAWHCKRLHKRVKILVADPVTNKLEPLAIPSNCRGIVLANIQSYAGGNHLTSIGEHDDKLMEVFFVSGVGRMATAAATPFKLQVAAQTNRICIKTSQPLHCQVDGEPWLQSPGFFQISHYSQNAFLKKQHHRPQIAGGILNCASTSGVVETRDNNIDKRRLAEF